MVGGAIEAGSPPDQHALPLFLLPLVVTLNCKGALLLLRAVLPHVAEIRLAYLDGFVREHVLTIDNRHFTG